MHVVVLLKYVVLVYRLHFNVFVSHAITLNVFFAPSLRLRREINKFQCGFRISKPLQLSCYSIYIQLLVY